MHTRAASKNRHPDVLLEDKMGSTPFGSSTLNFSHVAAEYSQTSP
jgi:hypothetical protein